MVKAKMSNNDLARELQEIARNRIRRLCDEDRVLLQEAVKRLNRQPTRKFSRRRVS